jgi:hypothetical protein
MPYTKDGIRPDIIINPHAIPSRMTIGHLVECIFAKLCCIDGVLGDASVFIPIENETIYNRLTHNGFNKYGNEILYNGFTGNQIDTEIFIGPTYYFRLKHMVAEKINSRGVGKVMGLTRQPTEGRRKGGGLRIGEMERDTVLSHGISNFIKESMMERSDKFCWCVCKRCGTLVAFNVKENINMCRNCKTDDVAVIHTPYAFKLFIQELETMGIQPRINTEAIDMPVDQLEFTRSYDDDDDNNGDDKGDNKEDDKENKEGRDADNFIKDIEYNLFNSQIDNFATPNTIKDEKIWKDTYSNKYGKMKGGIYEEEEEDQESEEEDQESEEEDSEEEDQESEEEVSEEEDQEDQEEEEESENKFSESEEDQEDQEESEEEDQESEEEDQESEEEEEESEEDQEESEEESEYEVSEDQELLGVRETDDTKKIVGGGVSDIKELYIEM